MSPALSKKFIEDIELKLVEEKAEVEAELLFFANNSAGKDEHVSDREDRGTQEEDNATEVASHNEKMVFEESLEKNLGKINRALKKVKKGTYGKCEKCNKIIPKARLEVFPAAEKCVNC